MIAEIQPSFSSHLSMSRKIEYQLSKVKEGNGKVLYTSTGDELAAMPAYMKLISQLNDRVKLPYAEFILSLIREKAFPMNSGFLLPGNISRGWGTESPVMPLS